MKQFASVKFPLREPLTAVPVSTPKIIRSTTPVQFGLRANRKGPLAKEIGVNRKFLSPHRANASPRKPLIQSFTQAVKKDLLKGRMRSKASSLSNLSVDESLDVVADETESRPSMISNKLQGNGEQVDLLQE